LQQLPVLTQAWAVLLACQTTAAAAAAAETRGVGTPANTYEE
jgi:hypothetical protein